MRKEAGFEVLDRINVYYEGNDKIAEIFAKNGESIGKDVLAEAYRLVRLATARNGISMAKR